MNTPRRRILELTFMPDGLDQIQLLEVLVLFIKRTGLDTQLDTTQFGCVGGDHFLTETRAIGSWNHGFKTSEMQVIAGINGTTGVKIFQLHIEEKIGGSVDGRSLVSDFLEDPNFLSGRIADAEFEYWENADQLCLYEWKGRSHEGKRLVSNGLPFPLEEMVVDTSDNPGRRLFKPGYIEALGYEMWLSLDYLRRIGRPDVQGLRLAGWNVELLAQGALHLAVERDTLRENGPQEQQQRLRRALFSDTTSR